MRTQEASYDLTGMAFDGQNQNEFKGDENLRVQFSLFPVYNKDKSDKEGRAIYDEQVFVTIIVPGQTDIVHRQAWERDFKRFPRQYQAFQANKDQDAASGTPLAVLTWLSAAQVKELEFFNVRTVEQLANMPDSVAGRFMAIQQLKARAKDFLDAAAKAAPLTRMRAEIEERDAKIGVLESALEQLKARLDAIEAEAA